MVPMMTSMWLPMYGPPVIMKNGMLNSSGRKGWANGRSFEREHPGSQGTINQKFHSGDMKWMMIPR